MIQINVELSHLLTPFLHLWCSESVLRGPHLIQHMSAEVE